MSDDVLAAEGWLAPARPGPTRRTTALLVGLGIVVLGGWAVAIGDVFESLTGDGSEQYRISIADDGAATIERTSSGTSTGDGHAVALRSEVRSSRSTPFMVARGSIDGVGHGDLDVRLALPAGVDEERTSLRVERPRIGSDQAHVVLVIPASLLPAVDATKPVGTVRSVTGDIDRRIAVQRADERRVDALRRRAWLVALLGVAVSVGVPLALWHRVRRRFFSMRRPGSGTELDPAPPSSLDPVGAAVLIAGAGPVDASAAFTGHVLDLVERRQLQMRRTMDGAPGVGVLIGLGHAEEAGDDVAVAALRAIADEDLRNVGVPDNAAKARRVPEPQRDDWHLHVAARERFEGMVDRVDPRRIVGFAAVLTAVAPGALVAGVMSDLPGRRALLSLVAALAIPAAVALALWARDAHRWRIVTRARRNERAQWLAWRAAVGTSDGPALDPRNIPVIAATGTSDAGIRAFAGPDAVGFDAVTTKTIATLRALVADESP